MQTALPLAWPSRYDVNDYITDDSNDTVLTTMLTADKWRTPTLILCGDKSGGKTHLAHIFATSVQAAIIHNNVQATNFIEGEQGYALVDDVDIKLRDNVLDQKILFHMFNVTVQRAGRLLLTSTLPVTQWVTLLPDLTSRLVSSHMIRIGQPEVQVVRAAFQKLFADRGLIVDDKVIDFLATRSERGFRHITATVCMLDRLALEKARRITVPLVQSTGLFN